MNTLYIEDVTNFLGDIPQKTEIFGDSVNKEEIFDDIMTYGKATYIKRLTIWYGTPQALHATEKRVYGFRFDYLESDGSTVVKGRDNIHKKMFKKSGKVLVLTLKVREHLELGQK